MTDSLFLSRLQVSRFSFQNYTFCCSFPCPLFPAFQREQNNQKPHQDSKKRGTLKIHIDNQSLSLPPLFPPLSESRVVAFPVSHVPSPATTSEYNPLCSRECAAAAGQKSIVDFVLLLQGKGFCFPRREQNKNFADPTEKPVVYQGVFPFFLTIPLYLLPLFPGSSTIMKYILPHHPFPLSSASRFVGEKGRQIFGYHQNDFPNMFLPCPISPAPAPVVMLQVCFHGIMSSRGPRVDGLANLVPQRERMKMKMRERKEVWKEKVLIDSKNRRQYRSSHIHSIKSPMAPTNQPRTNYSENSKKKKKSTNRPPNDISQQKISDARMFDVQG